MKPVRESGATRNSRVRGGFIVVASLLILQIYAVRELLAAELLFAIGFLFLGLLGVIFYLVGGIAERAAMNAEALMRPIGPSVQHGWQEFEGTSRRWLGHPRAVHEVHARR